MMLTACATMAPPQPPSLDLPKPPADLRAARKGERVTLTWSIPSQTTDRQTIRSVGPTRICRALSEELTQCQTPVGVAAPPANPGGSNAKQKATNTYTDTIAAQQESNSPAAVITYAVEVLNHDGRSAGLSNQVHVPLILTLPPPRDFQAQLNSQGVVLRWTGETAPALSRVHFVYRVYRRRQGEQQRILVGDVPAADEHGFSLTDSQIDWQKTYDYTVEAVTVIDEPNRPEMQVEGEDTPDIKVFADDTFPPAVPTGLQAVFSGPGQAPFIDLVWAPVSDADLAGYNVYRHEQGAPAGKINSELVRTPAYRDTNVVSGRHYLYSVSSVDLRGNESARSEEAAETVP
jgi:hypothetical protein